MAKKTQAQFLINPPLKIGYDAAQKKIHVTAPAGQTVMLNGADFQQIVNDRLEVCAPLSEKTVRLSFKITQEQTGKTDTTVDYAVTIPGRYPPDRQFAKPAVIPELAEWHGTPGTFTTTGTTQIVVSPAYQEQLAFMTRQFAQDYEALTGRPVAIRYGDDPNAGDFYFTLGSKDVFLGTEGYHTLITDTVKTDAVDAVGAYWAAQSLLQILKQSRGQDTVPCGEIRDYPKFPVRGFMVDVGRRPVSLYMLRQIIKNMAWYKMNDLQIHLNDNYIWLEDYHTNKDELNTFSAYEAFRLESSLQNKKGQSLTAPDYSYSKAEFKQLIAHARKLGIRIIPEIDVPAHALSFTKVFPEYMVKGRIAPLTRNRPLTDHLDISREEVIDFIKQIFDDYTKGDAPVFDRDTVVHIGADEFLSDYSAYRRFFNNLVPYIKQTNQVRVWGSLTWIKDNPVTEILPNAIENVQMNLWANRWADGVEMYRMGFQLINTIDQYVYMVPNGTGKKGAYQDYLNKKALYKNFAPHKVRLKTGFYSPLPAGDPQVLGAVYAIWHDNIDKRASGLTETDLFVRFFDALPLMSEKTWANGDEKGSIGAIDRLSAAIGIAPCSDPYYDLKASASPAIRYPLGVEGMKDTVGTGQDILACHNAEINPEGYPGLHLHGGTSYALLPINQTGPGHFLRFTLTLDSAAPGQILFETDPDYNTHDIRITADGKLGFTREGYEYAFDYMPPVNAPVVLELQTGDLITVLLVNGKKKCNATGKFLHNGVVKKDHIKNASFQLPLKRIGSATNAVSGRIADVQVGSLASSLKKKKCLFF